MPSPYRSVPSLACLRTFEAVARNGGFTLAGDELALTQSAVSHQIRQLEVALGCRLFTRSARTIDLTDDGRTMLEGVRAGLDSILLATERVRARRRVGTLSIGAPLSFAGWWLAPRLGRFAMRAPDIEVRLAVVDGESDLDRLCLDAAIVQRPPDAPARPDEMVLLREECFPVCAPTVAGPDDLCGRGLIDMDGDDAASPFGWTYWLKRLGLDPTTPRRLRFNDPGLAISAAIEGLGVAIGRSPMIDAELAAGRLVRPLGERVAAAGPHRYALKWRDGADQRLIAFRDFALDEACGCELAAGPCGMPRSARDDASTSDLAGGRVALRSVA
jgi:LysR family glycine cleavage system transcriptional activator